MELNDIPDRCLVREGPYGDVYRVPSGIRVIEHYPNVLYCKHGKKYSYVQVKKGV